MERRSLPLLLLAAALASSCKKGDAGAALRDAGAQSVTVGAENVAVVKRETLSTGPRLSGSLDAREKAVVRAELGGQVLAMTVERGQAVKKGQVLARIEARAASDAYQSAQSSVRSAEQQAEVARRQLERTQRLVAGGAVAERDLETAGSAATAASAQAAEARSRLAAARKQIDAATVEAPLTGVVSERGASAGDVVAPGGHLFTVIDPSSMRLEATVPSDQLPALHIGAPVSFVVRGLPGQTFAGKIERIAPAVDPATRQIPILVSIPNPGGKLLAGLFAEGRIASKTKETLVVPLAAVETIGGEASAIVIRGGKAERVTVSLGMRDEQTERAEVTSGLTEGDRVLVGTARGVAPGTRVELTGVPERG